VVARPPFAVSHIFFDVDGTLVDLRGAIGRALEAVASRAAELSGGLVTPAVVGQARDLVAAEPEWRRRPASAIRRESLRRLLIDRGVQSDEAAGELLQLYYGARNAAMVPYPDVEETLRALTGRRLTLVAASNGNVDLGELGLGGYFAGTHYAEEVGIMKPDPRFFTSAAERSGIQPADALVVGDRIDNDYEPAVAAGMHAVVVDRHDGVEDPEVPRVRSLTEVPALVRRR
jgi:putative hydrolase of the HAD superfamily